jgi:glucuronoarabinoxylan endo-1,4-beta-xylanase
MLDIVGAHTYEFGWAGPDPMTINMNPLTASVAAGKRIWMTEWNAGKFGGPNDMAAVRAIAKLIHAGFTDLNFNAFVYWWAANLLENDVAAKSLWTIGQWSRFVRPGWNRVDYTQPPVDDVLVSAFTNDTVTRTAIVVVNLGSVSQTFSLVLDSREFEEVSVFRTSVTENMAPQDTIPGGKMFIDVTVPADTITTYSASLR